MTGQTVTFALISGGFFFILGTVILRHGAGDEMGGVKLVFALGAIVAACIAGAVK